MFLGAKFVANFWKLIDLLTQKFGDQSLQFFSIALLAAADLQDVAKIKT